MSRRTSEVCKCTYIHHFHIDHNARCLPTKLLYNHCLRFLFGRLQYSENTLPLQQEYRALSFPLFSALKNVHPKYDALHESLILFDCQLLLHSRTCHQQKNGIVKSYDAGKQTETLRYILFLLNIHTAYKYSIYLFVVLNVASAIVDKLVIIRKI